MRVLARPDGDRRALAGLAVEVCEGDLGRSGVAPPRGPRRAHRLPRRRRLPAVGAPTRRSSIAPTSRAPARCSRPPPTPASRRVVYTSSVGALGIPKDGTPGTETTPVTLADMVGPYKASKFLAEQVGARVRAPGAAGRHRESLDAGRAVGRQADADRPDGRRFPAGPDVRDARHRPQPGPRARRRARPPAGRRARQGRREVHPRQRRTSRWPRSACCSPRSPGRRAPRVRIPYAVAWLRRRLHGGRRAGHRRHRPRVR